MSLVFLFSFLIWWSSALQVVECQLVKCWLVKCQLPCPMNPHFHNWIPPPNDSIWSLIVPSTMSQWQNKCSDSGWMGSIFHLLNQKTSKVIDNDNIIDNIINSVIDNLKELLRLAMLITAPAAPNWVGRKRVPPRDWWWGCCPGHVVCQARRLLCRISCSPSLAL